MLFPATFTFPSAMLLYWVSSSLAAIIADFLSRIRIFRLTVRPRKGNAGEDQPKPKPKMQEYRGPTMKELQNRKKKR